MMARAKHLIGRTIVAVSFNSFPARPGKDRTMAHYPYLTLDDGSRICFSTEETDIGEYGTRIVRIPPPPRKEAMKSQAVYARTRTRE